jgi:hypothetical protein
MGEVRNNFSTYLRASKREPIDSGGRLPRIARVGVAVALSPGLSKFVPSKLAKGCPLSPDSLRSSRPSPASASHYPRIRMLRFQARQGCQIVAHGAADAVGKPWGSEDLTFLERRRRDRCSVCPMSQRSCAIRTAICRPCRGSKRFWASHFPRLASLSVGHNLTALNGPTTMSGPSYEDAVMRSALGGGLNRAAPHFEYSTVFGTITFVMPGPAQ